MGFVRLVFITIAGIGVAMAGSQITHRLYEDPGLLSPIDSLEYWGAARLNLDGHDPYDPIALRDLQKQANPEYIKNAIMMWNPPFTFSITMPLGGLSWRTAQILWMALQLGSILIASDLFWRYYGGSAKYCWVAWFLALLFGPTLMLLRVGQIAGFLVLAMAVFLYAARYKRPILMGIAVAVMLIKPHLFVLFGICFLLEAFLGRRTASPSDPDTTTINTPSFFPGLVLGLLTIGMLVAGVWVDTFIMPEYVSLYWWIATVAAGLWLLIVFRWAHRNRLRHHLAFRAGCVAMVVLIVTSLVPMAWNRHVWSQYITLTQRPPSADFDHRSVFEQPTIGYAIRRLVPKEPFEAQFYPVFIAASCLPLYWLLRRRNWDWEAEMPRLTLGCALTACYGAWFFDLVILLLPVIQAAVWLRLASWLLQLFFLMFFLVITVLAVGSLGKDLFAYHLWVTPWITVGYIMAGLCMRTLVSPEIKTSIPVPTFN